MEKEFVCPFRDRCETWSFGCTRDVATISNCGFIAAVEKEKKEAREALYCLIEECGGVISFESRQYLSIRADAKHLTADEFFKAFASAQRKFLTSSGTDSRRSKNKSTYFVK